MRYATFGPEKGNYKIAILVKDLLKEDIRKAYIAPYGIDESQVIIIDLHVSQTKKKTPAAEQKAYITEELRPVLLDLGVEHLIVGDGDYFKILAKVAKVDPMIGYVLSTEFGPWNVVYVPNFRMIFADPLRVTQKIDAGINALKSWVTGTYVAPGVDVLKFSAYPKTYDEIADWLDRLIEMDCDLAIDIEGFSLKHYDVGIGTISFAWSKTEGIAFAVDYVPVTNDPDGFHGKQVRNEEVRELLRSFFYRFKRKARYHRVIYDVYVLIYQLFMKDLLDNEGLLHGLDVMLANFDCTLQIAYLATNSTAGNRLGLKTLAQEHSGNYAVEEIKDIRKIPLPHLLQYNLIDTVSTNFVHEKYWSRLVADQQLEIYQTIFQPAVKDIIQMQLTGMPMNRNQVLRVKEVLEAISNDAIERIRKSPIVEAFQTSQACEWAIKRNEELKKKRVTPLDYKEEFNPGSAPQLQKLLYDKLGLPVLDYTDSRLPATKGKTLEKLVSHTENQEVKDFLAALMDFKAVEILLTTFIPAFENAQLGPDGWYWLFGFFNLGGTLSGRLSSSDPNLQNIPANKDMAISETILAIYGAFLEAFVKKGRLHLGKLIKSCFEAPPGWFFCGIDFMSLEDRISALTTKDPNKLKVYTDGYDGHCLRAYAYFGDKMPDIDPTSVESINTIAKLYPMERTISKNPTFALTYDGDYGTLMRNYNFSEELARKCEDSYKELYKVSIDWVNAKLDQAAKDGYVTVAFGLRVRTPMLAQVIRGTSKTPSAAEAEGRSAGNALGQSWCLLNSRAGSEFNGKVRKSEFKHDIKPCAQIHDAQYMLVRDNIDAIEYANIHVVAACEWQDHPDIWHDEVKLGGKFSIFYPTWSYDLEIPNKATQAEILAAFEGHITELAA